MCSSSTSTSTFNRSSLESSSLSPYSPLGLNFLRKEDLRGKGKDWERKEGGGSNHFRAWWWCIDGIVGITGRGSGVNLWGVRTGRGRTSHFWIMEGLFLEEEEMVMKKQKEWRLKEDLCLFNSPTKVKWIDTTLMKCNVCLPNMGNKMTLKWLRVLTKATCPISNVIRYNCLSIEV